MDNKLDLGKHAHRHIPLEGSYNIRDIGGYPTQDGRHTRWRTVIRADNLDQLPEASQQALVQHGVGTVIDLRTEREITKYPDVFATSSEVEYHHLPVFSDEDYPKISRPTTLGELYCLILDECQPRIKAILEQIANSQSRPVIIHCSAGKDRTGLITALLLGLAQVEPHTIVEDYSLSRHYLHPRVEEWRLKAIASGQDMSRFDHEMSSDPETMHMALDHLQTQYGGIESYLQTIGLTEKQISQLHIMMVE